MPRRKSDAAEGGALVPETGVAEEAPPPDAEAAPGSAPTPEAAPEPEPAVTLSTPDVAAEPGAPEPVGPAPDAPDPSDSVEPYREPEIDAAEHGAEAAPGAEPLPETEPLPEPLPEPEPLPRPDLVPPASAAEVIEEAQEHEEESGWSFAARALATLILLIAGGALALWGAPRIAPHLPAGIASWLAPASADVDARIAELASQLDARLGDVEGRVAGLAVPADVDASIEAATGRLGGEIEAVRQSLSQLGGSDLPQQVARLESALDGQLAELATLKDQLGGAALDNGALSQEALQRIDIYRAELDGLRAEVGSLQDRVAGLVTRVDQAVAGAEREVEEARERVAAVQADADTRLSAAEVDANIAAIRAALASGAPYEAPLAALAAQDAVPDGLAAAASTGVATMAELRDEFPDAAHAAIRAGIMAGSGAGPFDRTRAFLGAQVASRSLTPQEGLSPDAVLSRAEDRLRQDDLAGALAEADALPAAAQAAMASWLDAARRRAAAVEGLGTLADSPPATN